MISHYRATLLPLIALLLAASSGCTSESDDSGSGGECFHREDELSTEMTCNFQQPCADVEYVQELECEVTADYDPTVGACVIASLRDGERAMHRIRDCPGGQYSWVVYLEVFGDGTVLQTKVRHNDDSQSSIMDWRSLAEPSYFDSCETDTLDGFLACIDGMLGECQLGEPTCS